MESTLNDNTAMKTITIDRSKWRTGEYGPHETGKGDTQLLNQYGFMCCLGFACQQIAPTTPILDLGQPYQIQAVVKGITVERVDEIENWYDDSDFSSEAITINDSKKTTPFQKEAALIELCKKHPEAGIMFEFVGEYSMEGEEDNEKFVEDEK